ATETVAIDSFSLHDALPISDSPRLAILILRGARTGSLAALRSCGDTLIRRDSRLRLSNFTTRARSLKVLPASTSGRSSATSTREDRKSTRLNSSHVKISYAV